MPAARLALLPLLLLAGVLPARAQDSEACRAAIAAVEPGSGVMPGVLEAIARVESGRRSPGTGLVQPWPWAINIGGESRFAASRAEAVAQVVTARALGVQQIDVGCMQISLMHHPQAFATLDEAFDPLANVTYAARFLADLRRRSADWPEAIGRYHSGTPDRAAAYLARVTAMLEGGPLPPAASGPGGAEDRVVALRAPAAQSVRVIVPGQAAPPLPGLPRVITPTRR
jgi:hypothetical protein